MRCSTYSPFCSVHPLRTCTGFTLVLFSIPHKIIRPLNQKECLQSGEFRTVLGNARMPMQLRKRKVQLQMGQKETQHVTHLHLNKLVLEVRVNMQRYFRKNGSLCANKDAST